MNRTKARASLQFRTVDGEKQAILGLTPEEFEQIVKRYTVREVTDKRLADPSKRFKEAQDAARPGEELKKENYDWAPADDLERAVCIMYCWTKRILDAMLKEQDLRIEIVRNTEDLRAELYIYTAKECVSDCTQQEC